MKYKIFKNVLSESDFKKLESIISSDGFPWYYSPTIAKNSDNKRFYFSHMIYMNDKINSDYYNLITPILDFISVKESQLLRIKVNCFVRETKNFKSLKHIDDERKHKVFLYYVNSNNGYTILHLNDKKIKVPSIKNTGVLFDGDIEHQAVSQTDTKVRHNININYI
jgi:hypothetical protein